MDDRPEYLEGQEFIFKYGRLRLLPLDQLRKDEFGETVASDQKMHRRERVVRCRDCANAFASGGLFNCMHFAQWDYYNDCPGEWTVEPDGFCAWGKERDA